jgi:hypothetical protein
MQDRTNKTAFQVKDPAEFSRNMIKVAIQSQRLVTEFMKAQAKNPSKGGSPDPLNLGQTFVDFLGHAMRNPGHFVEANFKLWHDYLNLWHHTARRMLGEDTQPVIEPSPGDKRFKDRDWSENQVFDFIKQSYLLSARWLGSGARREDAQARRLLHQAVRRCDEPLEFPVHEPGSDAGDDGEQWREPRQGARQPAARP